MAGILAHAQTGAIATGTSPKTLLQVVAAANHRVLVHEVGISFDGISNTATPIKVDLIEQTDAGTSSALTLVKNGDYAETLQTTGRHTATVEPAGSTIKESFYVHPQQGRDWVAPLKAPIIIPGGARLGLRVTAAASVNALACMKFEE